MAQSIQSNGYSLNYFDSKKYGEIDFVIQNNNIDQFIVNVCNYIKDNINDIKKKLLILDTLNNNPKEIICDDEIIKLSYEFIDEYKNIQ